MSRYISWRGQCGENALMTDETPRDGDDTEDDYYSQMMKLPVHIRVQMAIGDLDVLLRAALAALRGETPDDQREATTSETDGEQGQDASGGESGGNGSTNASTMDT